MGDQMRMMMTARLDTPTSNGAITDGSIAAAIGKFVEQYKPEASYFFPDQGKRTALMVFDLADPSEIVAAVEPFFANLNAEISLTR
jgi:hypothetical protein